MKHQKEAKSTSEEVKYSTQKKEKRTKRRYQKPEIEEHIIDNGISLQMSSGEPGGPGGMSASRQPGNEVLENLVSDPLNDNSFDESPFK